MKGLRNRYVLRQSLQGAWVKLEGNKREDEDNAGLPGGCQSPCALDVVQQSSSSLIRTKRWV